MDSLIPRLITPLFLLFALLFPSGAIASVNQTGSGITQRYWDCCKPDCSWPAKASVNQPVAICDNKNNPLTDFNTGSSCGGGETYPCADQLPWAVNDTFSYGYAGLFLMDHASDAWCCACYELTFTSGDVKGQKMVVQAHNSGFDLTTANRFSLAVPGGNTSYANACSKQYGVEESVFGVENKGVESRKDCDALPEALREGCYWRFDWFKNADRPDVDYKRVPCPETLTSRTGCIRDDEAQLTGSTAPIVTALYSTSIFAALSAIMFNIL
ncbi:hypothetical protein FQN54_008841 [Arachnomyces sp. PD_36]|nr:hypothetical protein FQN54_008841 [Arachnomyces sp. PD_36]